MAQDQAEQVISEQPEKLQGKPEPATEEPGGPQKLWLCVAALGVVYGDIGTSPLYALRKCFHEENGLAPSSANVLGVVSLIFWSLIIVVSIKYLAYVMRADNEGEGGILALMALAAGSPHKRRHGAGVVIAMGVFGAALLYGDGMITPAISVLSAVEGLEIATDATKPYVVPITIVILVLLFLFQKRGTRGVGSVFGPVMLVWFVVLAVLGISGIVRHPDVLAGLNPLYAGAFMWRTGWPALITLGAVFLVVTGSEALYADLGHFGRAPIRLPWFAVVLPALTANYLGQGALLLRDPATAAQPFYLLAPGWALYPLVVLAVAATIIASQAVISAAFSLSRQAVLLGRLPRLHIVFTSDERVGQIYIPIINWMLMVACVGLVLGFRRSTNLAGAYGVAVSTTLVITTVLAYVVARQRWGWGLLPALLVTALLLIVDIAFFGANLFKIRDGGWFPLLVAAAAYVLMATWKRGRTTVQRCIKDGTEPIEHLLERIKEDPPARVPGTAVFMTEHSEGTPAILRHNLKHNRVLHEHVVLLTVSIEDVPRVGLHKRLEVSELGNGFTRVIARFGFMDTPDVPAALRSSGRFGLEVDPDEVTYYIGRQTLIPGTKEAVWRRLRHRLFAFLARNAAEPTTFFRLPPARVFEAGIRIEL